jgi:hypothetical protein
MRVILNSDRLSRGRQQIRKSSHVFCLAAVGLATVAAALAVSVEPSSAQNRRWCTERGVGSWGFPNCAYDTYQQCAATASGLGLRCTENLQYQPERKAAPRKSRKKRRSDD